jgi:protein ImuA
MLTIRNQDSSMTRLFTDNFPLRRARAHEVTGPAAVTFAVIALCMGGSSGLWVREGWRSKQLHADGLAAFCDPGGLIFATGKDQRDVLAVAEEALRSGAVPMVVAELTGPLSLTAGRRLQLAAEAGQATGIFILPEGMGSNAAETRWRCIPLFDPEDSTLQSWELIKNKSGTIGAWTILWDAQARRVIVVSEVGK